MAVRPGKASRVLFPCVFSIPIKREAYDAVVFPTSLYGAETWTAKAGSVRKLKGFNKTFSGEITSDG